MGKIKLSELESSLWTQNRSTCTSLSGAPECSMTHNCWTHFRTGQDHITSVSACFTTDLRILLIIFKALHGLSSHFLTAQPVWQSRNRGLTAQLLLRQARHPLSPSRRLFREDCSSGLQPRLSGHNTSLWTVDTRITPQTTPWHTQDLKSASKCQSWHGSSCSPDSSPTAGLTPY